MLPKSFELPIKLMIVVSQPVTIEWIKSITQEDRSLYKSSCNTGIVLKETKDMESVEDVVEMASSMAKQTKM